MDVTANRTRRAIYEHFVHHNIASVKKHAMCIPSHSLQESSADDEDSLKPSSCHIVYMDGAPSYPPTGWVNFTSIILVFSHIWPYLRPSFWYSVDRTIQWVQANTADISFGSFPCWSGGESEWFMVCFYLYWGSWSFLGDMHWSKLSLQPSPF